MLERRILYAQGSHSLTLISECQLVHHMFPNSNCHLHEQVLSSHGGRLLLFHGWVFGESDPSACLWYSGCTYGFSVQGHLGLLFLRRRLARRQPQWCKTSGGLKKPEEAKAFSRKLMARPLALRCVTTYGHLDALAIVFLSRSCTTVRGVVSILVYQLHRSTVKATAPSRVYIYCHRRKVTGRQ